MRRFIKRFLLAGLLLSVMSPVLLLQPSPKVVQATDDLFLNAAVTGSSSMYSGSMKGPDAVGRSVASDPRRRQSYAPMDAPSMNMFGPLVPTTGTTHAGASRPRPHVAHTGTDYFLNQSIAFGYNDHCEYGSVTDLNDGND